MPMSKLRELKPSKAGISMGVASAILVPLPTVAIHYSVINQLRELSPYPTIPLIHEHAKPLNSILRSPAGIDCGRSVDVDGRSIALIRLPNPSRCAWNKDL